MLTKEKLAYSNRLDLAKDIVLNVKDDFKILMERCEAQNNERERLLNAFLAKEAIDVAQAIGKLQMTILEAEKHLAEYMSKHGE